MKIAKMEVTLVDTMGSDLSVVNAARVSFHKESQWKIKNGPEGWEDCEYVLADNDRKLIKYLAKYNHWSPFAHSFVSLRIKAPIFVARQLAKHQIGLSWNEVSRRYVDDEPEFYLPKHEWRLRAENKKQGSLDTFIDEDTSVYIQTDVEKACQMCLDTYNFMLRCNIAPEQARMILPHNTMTEWIWSGSLMAFARVCNQRLDPHAQLETQEVAKMIADIVEPLFPMSWKELVSNS